jgi:hypothetical protein
VDVEPREHRQGIEFWTTGEIQEASTGINLLYRNIDESTVAEYGSVIDNYLILPDEEFDPETRQVKEQSAIWKARSSVDLTDPSSLGSIDDHPF